MNRGDLSRQRRCRALQLAVAFGVLLPVLTRTWISLAVAAGGVALALATYWRLCRGSG